MNKLLTVAEVAQMMQVGANTVYRWIAGNKIPYTKLPGGGVRFDQEKLNNWLKNRTARVA